MRPKNVFPAAREVHAMEFDEATRKLDPNGSSYIVIVTRGHRDDMRICCAGPCRRALVMSGMIGSKRKVIEIFKTLRAEGVPAQLVRSRACSGGTRYRRGNAGGNCGRHYRGIDRHPPPRHGLPSAFELV